MCCDGCTKAGVSPTTSGREGGAYLLMPGVAHAIHLWWFPPDWRFGGWYINLQEPIRPTRLGFDSMDHILDVVIEPDLSWRWKDEDELFDLPEPGWLSAVAD